MVLPIWYSTRLRCPPHTLNRQKEVRISEAVSTTGYANGGVPHGTLSGPTHFLVHINDLHTPCPLYQYVDDCTVFDICSHTRGAMLHDSVDILANWTTDNDMCINASKTKQMIACFCRDEAHEASLVQGCNECECAFECLAFECAFERAFERVHFIRMRIRIRIRMRMQNIRIRIRMQMQIIRIRIRMPFQNIRWVKCFVECV